MPTPPSFETLLQAGRDEVQARNPALTDFTPGSALDAVVGGGAALADEVVRLVLAAFAEHFVDLASGDALDALALDRFGLTRKPASAAVGTLTFTRGSSSGALPVPLGTRCRAEVDGQAVLVQTTAAATLGSGDATVDIAAAAGVSGAEGNLAAGVIDEIVDPIPGDPDAAVTNAARFAGGAEAESDETFRDRIRRYFQTLRRGTTAALEAGALSVAGVRFATVDESFVAPEDGGYVGVYVGDPDARASAPLLAQVTAELESWRAAGVQVQVLAAEREEIPLALTVLVDRGADQATLQESVRAAVLDVTDTLAPGETLYLARVQRAALNVAEALLDAKVTDPAGDLAPSQPYYALRVNAEDLAVTITEL